jgi:hypothetical protein
VNPRQLADTLNRLLHAERGSLIGRLAESTAFISWTSAEEALALNDMIAQEREQVAWLLDLINDIGESPTPASPDINWTSFHFVDVRYFFPAVIEDLGRRISLCSETAARVAHHADSADVVNRLADRHRHHLDELKTMQAAMQASSN